MADQHLPLDLIYDIFCRLPVKTLARFKSISKLCASLIEDPGFKYAHLMRSVKTGNNFTLILIDRTYTTRSNHIIRLQLRDTAELNPNPLEIEKFTCPLPGIVRVLGSHDRLLCLINQQDQIIVWDLAIREHHVVPDTPSRLNDNASINCSTYESESNELFVDYFNGFHTQIIEDNARYDDPFNEYFGGVVPQNEDYARYNNSVYGFGYDSINDDYKLVKIEVFLLRCRIWDRVEKKIYKAKTYSLKNINNGMWKRSSIFEDNPNSYLLGLRGTYLAGNLHWVSGIRMNWKIIAFALATEEFYAMPLPDDLSVQNYSYTPSLGVLGGSLFAIGYMGFGGHSSMHLWVMKDYMVKESWTKFFSATVQELGSLSYPLLVYSKRCKRGDEVLMKDLDGRLLWYDPVKKKVEKVNIPGLQLQEGNGAEVCLPRSSS